MWHPPKQPTTPNTARRVYRPRLPQLLESEGLAPDGVCTFNEMSVPIAARLAEAMNLPGNPVAAVDAARDKYATRAIMEAAGLATPANALIEKAEDLSAAAAKVGFPAVIKPIAGAGSMGVVRVDSEEELRLLYDKVVQDMGRAVVTSGALVYAPESGETGGSSKQFEVVMMMEAYLDGPEVDVDIVLSEGKAQYAEVTDNFPTIEPYFQEVGANCPSTLTRAQQDELIALSVDATLSLGFTCGVFHVESKYTSQGARLIEVNCRMCVCCCTAAALLRCSVLCTRDDIDVLRNNAGAACRSATSTC